jgi:hypothetical protein
MPVRLSIVLLLFFFTQNIFAQSKQKVIIHNMIVGIESAHTLKYRFKKWERTKEGKMNFSETRLKVSENPKKIYLKVLGENGNPEVLWIEGKHNGDALVNPDNFPYMNLYLSPDNFLLRKNQHHNLLAVGFNYTNDILKAFVSKTGASFEKEVTYVGDIVWEGVDCHKIYVTYTPFALVDYVVKKDENLLKIASKLFINEFMILINNPEISDYYDVKEGQTIKIPNNYFKKSLLYIDKKTFLPVYQEMYDDKGLFEKYEYHELQLNIKINEEEFSPDYKEYGF